MTLFGNMLMKCKFNVKKNFTSTFHKTAVDGGLGFGEIQHESYDNISHQWNRRE